MASVTVPSVPANLDLWDVAFAKLPSKDQQTLRSGLGFPVSIEDVRASIAEARGKADKKWTIKGQRGDINLRVHFDKIVHWVQEFIAIGDTIVTYDPGHAALPWAAMRFLLQILVNNSERAAGFINGLNELAFYIYFCTKVERHFLRDETYEERFELKNRIIDLYSTILQFMLKARKYFETSSAIRQVAGLHKPTDEITKILSFADSQFQKIPLISTFVNTQLQQITRDCIEHLSKSHTESMASLNRRLENPLRLLHDSFTNSEITTRHREIILRGVRELVVSRKVRPLSSLVRVIRLIITVRKAAAIIEGEEYKQYDRTAILRWLSAIPYQDHQTAARKEVQEGTGGWLLQDDVYRAWKASDETSLLWLRGPPGCGKSKLMSLAIEEALNGGTGSSDAGVFYFHCSNNPAEPERAGCESIIRCLVKQGSSGGTPSKPKMIPRYVVRAFKAAEVNGFASRHLSGEDCCAIMSKYAIDRGRMIIFLDALDECESEERDNIMDSLSKIVVRSGGALVKFLISSRDDVSLGSLLPKQKQFEIHVEENRNQQDIDGYIKAQLSQLIQQKKLRILGRKRVPKELQAKITDRLSQGARGMFRWVSIQLEYLCTLKTERDIENRLGQLPPKLIDIYGELFRRRTELYGPEHRRLLDLALSSLLLPIRPNATVFAQMLFAIERDEYSDEDESSSGSDADRSASGTVNRAQAVQGSEAVTELCFNLVVLDSTSSVFRFAHTSVQDYLLNHESGYYASQDLNSARVAEHCISLLLHVPDQIHEKDQMFLQSESQQEQTDCKTWYEDASTVDTSFWYLQPSPLNSRTGLEWTLAWVQHYWGFFVNYSRGYREKLPLRDLEVRLQHALVLQPWESVNPRIFFSACRYGLRSFVDTWTKTHAHLINVRLLSAADKKDIFLGTGLQHACFGGDSGTVERLIDEGAVIDYYSQGTPKTNALCIALQNRNTTITKLLLDRGASPSLALDADICFPLHSIIWDGHEDALSLVQMLLEHGADADLVDNQGMTAVAFAVEKENVEVVRLLLQKKAKTTLVLPSDLGVIDILLMATRIRTTPEKSWEMAQLMLRHGLDVNFRTAWDNTPLWWAANYGNLGVARLLLDHGASIDAQNADGITPLMTAINNLQSISETQVQIPKPPGKPLGSSAQAYRHEDVARLLISSGANSNLRSTSGWAALHYAAKNDSPEVVELLLSQSADPNIINNNGWTALHYAAENDSPEVVELLLSHSADPNITNNNNGWTALHYAANNGFPEVVELLLSYSADPNIINNNGCTALHYAAENASPKVVELLLSHSADLNIINNNGWTALRYAASDGHNEMVELLLANNADLHAREKEAWTALHCAARYGHESAAKLLLDHNADVKAPSSAGLTPLHLAAFGGHTNLIALLVDAGSDLSAINSSGHTALHEAALNGHDRAVEALLVQGADPNILASHGNNALSDAACSGKPKVCELLLPITTDINGQDGDGDTALSNAVLGSQPPYIIELLLGAGAQIVPQKPGPHCSFLDQTERIEGYGNDALLRAWDKENLELLQSILTFAAKRDPSGEYATALVLWEKKGKEGLATWMEARRANAPENRPEVVAFREKVKEREIEMREQNKQRLALELGLVPPVKESSIIERGRLRTRRVA